MSDTHSEYLLKILQSTRDAATANPTAANIAAAEKAKRALDEHVESSSGTSDRFPTQTAALEYLQRKWQIEKSKLSKDVAAGRVPKKDGHFSARDLDFYAEAVKLKPKTIEATPVADGSERLKSAMAEERELKVKQLKGELIDAAEEEARDARLWFAIRNDLENSSTVIANEMFNRIASLDLPTEIVERIEAIKPEIRIAFEDTLAEVFDRYARDGGVEA